VAGTTIGAGEQVVLAAKRDNSGSISLAGAIPSLNPHAIPCRKGADTYGGPGRREEIDYRDSLNSQRGEAMRDRALMWSSARRRATEATLSMSV
jgi:hypothetical protein